MPLHPRHIGEVFLVLLGLFYIGFGGYAMFTFISDPRISLTSRVAFLPAFCILPACGGVICHTLVTAWIRSWRAQNVLRRLPAVFE